MTKLNGRLCALSLVCAFLIFSVLEAIYWSSTRHQTSPSDKDGSSADAGLVKASAPVARLGELEQPANGQRMGQTLVSQTETGKASNPTSVAKPDEIPNAPKDQQVKAPTPVHEEDQATKDRRIEQTFKLRKANADQFCKRKNDAEIPYVSLRPGLRSHLLVDDKHKALFCIIAKAASSSWKAMYAELTGLAESAEALSHHTIHEGTRYNTLNKYSPEEAASRLETYRKVVVSRHPLHRVLSAYVDKYVYEPQYQYLMRYGRDMFKLFRSPKDPDYWIGIKSGLGVKFEEFLQFTTTPDRLYIDDHWRPVSEFCQPCKVKYDYYVHAETSDEESDYLMRLFGVTKKVKLPKHNQSLLSRAGNQLEFFYSQLPKNVLKRTLEAYGDDLSVFNYSTADIASLLKET
eukprot:m.2483 g.2483  ORF g.2483 m.2483 type:complete len:404 (+) comp8679_c0_seq2:385-1596(+)